MACRKLGLIVTLDGNENQVIVQSVLLMTPKQNNSFLPMSQADKIKLTGPKKFYWQKLLRKILPENLFIKIANYVLLLFTRNLTD